MTRFSRLNLLSLSLGLAFLYLPILLVVLYSFNESRLVTVWSGFSLKWYAALKEESVLLEAAWLSLRIAALSATIATALGTVAALAFTRLRRLPGRQAVEGQVIEGLALVPMVLPEVILGVALLLLFVTLGLERGLLTVVLAHATFGMAFALVVVRAKLLGLDPDLEPAARDLGAGPVAAFLLVTLPALLPAIAAAWLLAFTLSLDDLVIASFVNGPGATTLPIRIYSQVRLGVTPEANAIATLLITAVTICAIAASLLQQRGRLKAR